MLKDQRREKIVEIVNAEGFVKNLRLAELTDSTIQTIIADVNELSNLGKIVKVYGGAKVINKVTNFSEQFDEEKIYLNVDLKEKIGKIAAKQIENNDLVFIDTGTSTGWMARNLVLNKNATYVTNGYSIVKHLIEQDLRVLIVGGEIMPRTHAITGEIALKFLNNFNFTKSFIGMNGLFEDEFYTTNYHEGLVKETVIKNSIKSFVLMDSSKFNKKNRVKVELTLENKKNLILVSDSKPDNFSGIVLTEELKI